MQNIADVTTVAHVIQLAVAPVFLLTGIGAMLNVITTRLARIVDRFRVLDGLETSPDHLHQLEISMLSKRSRWVHWAVSLCTLAALLICIVIAALFVGSEAGFDPSQAVSLLFISAMLSLIVGLLCFLREIFLATGSIGVRMNRGMDL